MDWTIRLCYAVLLTSFTGSILYIAWQAAGWFLGKAGFIRVRYEMLKIVTMSFLIPAAYLFLKFKGDRREIGRGYLFAKTYGLLLAGKIFTVFWIGGTLIMLALLLRDSWRLYRKTKGLICCETMVCAQFKEIYRNLGGRSRRLQIYQSYSFTSPCMCGVLCPKVILPVQKYGKEELEVILTHEITHYLQGDAGLKWGVLLLRTFHFFNPVAWILCRKVREWSEYACDFRACGAMGGSARKYFQVITDIAMSPDGDMLTAHLTESKHELIARMDKIKETKKNRKAKFYVKAASAVLTGVVFMASSFSVYAAVLKSADGYEYLYHLTDFGVEEEYLPWINDDSEEYIKDSNAEGFVIRSGKANEINRTLVSSGWNIESGELMETEPFLCEKGNIIIANLHLSAVNATLKIGIILPNGNKQYIWSNGEDISHEFSVPSSGEYKIFVENRSKISVKVNGCHIFSHNRWDSIMHYSSSENEEGSHTYRIYCTGCRQGWTITLPCSYDQVGHHTTPY